VKLTLTREQSIRMHPKRHPITMTYTVGCDAGAPHRGQGAHGRRHRRLRLGGRQGARARRRPRLRAVPRANVDIDAIAAVTNNPPCGAMRGFGANQAHFAMEGCMDMLAAKCGLDGWEMRWRNAVEVGDTFASGQVFEKSVGIKKTLLAVKDAYYAARAAGRAVGIACGLKNSGIGNGVVEWGKARLVVEADGTVSLYNGYTEMGQGLLTVLSQFAAEVTGLPAAIFGPRSTRRSRSAAARPPARAPRCSAATR
jgi:CO/xanthine dehydrogenase Mo-binding subunit